MPEYSYRVKWSESVCEHVGLAAEFPRLSGPVARPEKAPSGIQRVHLDFIALNLRALSKPIWKDFMLVAQWEAFVAVAVVNVVTPGPTNLLMMNTGARLGRGPIVAFALGNILGLGMIGMLVAADLAQFIVKSAIAMQILRYVGGAYLIWLGIKLWRSDMLNAAGGHEIKANQAFRIALTNALSNPKPLFFFGTVLPLFISGGGHSFGDMAVYVITFMAISFVSLNIYGALAARAGALLRQAKVRAVFNRLCGATLIGYGAALACRQR